MGLREEQTVTPLSFMGLELGNESPIFKWEWFSEPLDCPPDEGCSPEPMVGTMSPLEGNPHPSGAGRKSGWLTVCLYAQSVVGLLTATIMLL